MTESMNRFDKVKQHGCTWRTGALVLALERGKKANELRGW